jgi:MoaA/NifB/PqqE/SkfB family radical SAM enzyme
MTIAPASAKFGVTERQGTTLVHDPATGLTHRHDEALPVGRVALDPRQVATWPAITPREYPGPVPLSLCWSPLVRCNLHCPHCLDDKTVQETGPAERARVAELLAASDVPGIDISGGEPLLLPDLPALADTLTCGGRAVSITTNGWHLRRRTPELAAHLDAVRVSLDGPTGPAHDAWRGEGSFARAMAGIEAAITAGLRVQIQTVLMAATRNHTQAILDLAAEHGAGGVTFLQMLPIGEGTRLGRDQKLSDAAAADLIRHLEIPAGLAVRLRTRTNAGGFTVVRADGRIWRNDHPAEEISAHRVFRSVEDLVLTGPDGAA